MLLTRGWEKHVLPFREGLDISGGPIQVLALAGDFVVRSVQALREVHLVLLVLIVAVGVVEDVLAVGGRRCRRTPSVVVVHARLAPVPTEHRIGADGGSRPIVAVAVFVCRAHSYVRGVLRRASLLTESARLTAALIDADDGVGLRDEAALLGFALIADSAQVLGHIGNPSHVLDLNNVRVAQLTRPLARLHQI